MSDAAAFLPDVLTFWPRLTAAQQALLVRGTRQVHYPKGAHVSSPTRECVGLLLVKSGGLRVYLLSEDGREVTLFRLGAGDLCVLSAACLLKDITFEVHIDATADSTCWLIDPDVAARLQADNLYVDNFLLRTTADKFSEVIFAIQQLLFLRLDQRLSGFLLDEAEKQQTPTLPLTHEEIARLLGSAREVISRMLKRFESDGSVRLFRGGIELVDLEKLRALRR